MVFNTSPYQAEVYWKFADLFRLKSFLLWRRCGCPYLEKNGRTKKSRTNGRGKRRTGPSSCHSTRTNCRKVLLLPFDDWQFTNTFITTERRLVDTASIRMIYESELALAGFIIPNVGGYDPEKKNYPVRRSCWRIKESVLILSRKGCFIGVI